MEAILGGVGPLAQVQDEACGERAADCIAQLSQTCKFFAVDPLRRLHLEGHDRAVVLFDNEVDLVAVSRAPVAYTRDSIKPRCLLHELRDHERLEQVPELGERCRLATGELVDGQTQQPRGDTGVENVDFRARGRTRCERRAPCRQSMHRNTDSSRRR